MYVWEWPHYPQYLIPRSDVGSGLLLPEDRTEHRDLGPARRHGLRVGPHERPSAAWVYDDDADPAVAGTVRFDWDALDAWFEEDEEIFVHPRNPYARVDAVRSRRHVRVELDGVLLAETRSPVLLFETGLPTRSYIDQADVRFEHLTPGDRATSCPYKGTTSRYWSVRTGGRLHPDLAWSYAYPTPAVAAIAGLVAFYDEAVDVTLDGDRLARPVTHFAR